MMTRRRALVYLLFFVLARATWADGFVVPPEAKIDPSIPVQRAILSHRDGVEVATPYSLEFPER